MSRRELAARPSRFALVVFSVAVGMAMVTAMRVSTRGAVENFTAEIDRLAGKADLQVTFGTGESGFPESVIDTVRAQSFVADAAAMVRGSLALLDGSDESLELFGVDVLQPSVLDIYSAKVLERERNELVIANDPYGIFLTESFARSRSLGVGGKIRLAGPTGVHEHTVRGIIADGGLADAFGGRIVVMFLPAAQQVLAKNVEDGPYSSSVDQIDVVLVPGSDVDAAERQLAAALPAELVVARPAQRRLAYEQATAGLSATLVGISSFVMLAALFVVYSTMTAVVRYRLPAMATMRMVGVTARSASRLIVAEAGILGYLGSLVGVALGIVASRFVIADVQGGMSLNYWLSFEGGGPAIDVPRLFVIQPLAGAAVAMLSALVPARSLLAMDPVEVKAIPLASIVPFRFAGARFVVSGLIASIAGVACIAYGVGTQAAGVTSFGSVALVTGLLLASLPLVPPLWRSCAPGLERVFGPMGRVAAANLGRGLERSMMVVAAIALCGAVAVSASTLPKSFRSSGWRWYGFATDAIVSSRTVKGGWLAQPVAGGLEAEIAALASVRGIDTIRVAQGQEYRGDRVAAVALSDGLMRSAIATAVERDGDASVVERRLLAGEAVAVSNNFARRYGVGPGQTLAVGTPTGDLSLPVAAVIPDYVSDRGSFLLSRELFRRRWNDHLVTFFSVALADGASVDALRRDVTRVLGTENGLAVMSSADLRGRTDRAIATAFADVESIQLLLAVITLVGIVDFLVTSTLDRRRELALLNTVGVTVAGVRRAITVEAATIGLTAGVIGAVLGVLFSWVWIEYTYPVLVGYVLELDVATRTVAFIVAAATVTAAMTGALAVSGVLRRSLAEGVRAE